VPFYKKKKKVIIALPRVVMLLLLFRIYCRWEKHTNVFNVNFYDLGAFRNENPKKQENLCVCKIHLTLDEDVDSGEEDE
jgi:hypothetical protein